MARRLEGLVLDADSGWSEGGGHRFNLSGHVDIVPASAQRCYWGKFEAIGQEMGF